MLFTVPMAAPSSSSASKVRSAGRGGGQKSRVQHPAAMMLLAIAGASMSALHWLQRDLSPIHLPVSFYVHGPGGILLPVALGSFGLAAAVLGRGVRRESATTSAVLIGFGIGMLVAAAFPADRWFPWEGPWSWSGLLHASAAVFAPPLLVIPLHLWRPEALVNRITRPVYWTGLLASGASLVVGLIRDQAPPLIGVGERILALSAVVWFAGFARRSTGTP